MKPNTENPHFARVERAPFEIGRLLQRMPEVFSAYLPIEPDHRLLGEAVAQHADNANQTLLSGLEALGHVLQVAGSNKEWTVDPDQISRLGGLIVHLAVEAQFLQEVESNFRYAIDADDKRQGKSGTAKAQ